MELKEKQLSIQNELKAPKDLKNDFAGFTYRSAEGIEKIVKPLLAKYKVSLTLEDDIVMVGERYYVKATAILRDIESDQEIITKAYAREQETKKGSDEAQITGACSSYARKYALCGLFLIDDSKDDIDSKDNTKEGMPLTKEQLEFIKENGTLIAEDLKILGIKTSKQLEKINIELADKLVKKIKELKND